MGFRFIQATTNTAGSGGSMAPSLGAPSTQGTLLVATVSSSAGANAFSSPGTGWQLAVAKSAGSGLRAELWYYPSNPGNLQTFTFTNGSTGVPKGSVAEYGTDPGTTQALDTAPAGASSSTPGTGSQPLTMASATASPTFGNDLGIGHFAAAFSTGPTGQSWTTPSGWTRNNQVATSTQAWASYYQLGMPQGSAQVTGVFSNDLDNTFWTALIALFAQMPGETLGITDRLSVSKPLAVPALPYHKARRKTRRPLRALGSPVTRKVLPGTPQHLGIVDTIQVTSNVTITFTPAAPFSTAAGEEALEFIPGKPWYPPANPVFIIPTLPRIHMQNLLTGKWICREVPNVTQPSVQWNLNAAGTFSCTINPPTKVLLDSTGNPSLKVWQTACYLEEAGEIKWGGILTQMQPNGPQLGLVFTEFSGYPNGMVYEGPDVSKTNYDALDAVRALWDWLQSQPNGNLGMTFDSVKSGVLLGQAAPFSSTSILSSAASAGDSRVNIQPPTSVPGQGRTTAFTVGQHVQVGNDPPHKITYAGTDHLLLKEPITSYQPNGSIVGQIQPTTPYTLNWWNSTDCGQEISQIQAEAVFDFRERHYWLDTAKSQVGHRMTFGVPRLGTRRLDLRFVEGENIVQAGQGNQDGSSYGNDIIGIGAGTGSGSVRAQAAVVGDRLRRTMVYTDQTVTRPDRLSSKLRNVLAAAQALDTIQSIVVRDHQNAPFGTFQIGDDIPVTLCTGWRNVLVWSRIISMQQDPQTNLITLGLARSDSFTYIPQTGAAGGI